MLVAVAAAMPAELRGIRREGRFREEYKDGLSFLLGEVRGAGVALFVSGIGSDGAYDAAQGVFQRFPVTAYLQIGYSAALAEDLMPGEIVIGEKIVMSGAPGKTYSSDAGLVEAACRAAGGCRKGTIFTASHAVALASEKGAIKASYPEAVALDMECYGAAKAAHEEDIPFLAIRAISDTAGEDLPVDFGRFIRRGKVSVPGLIVHLLGHPEAIMPMVRLGRQSRYASASLAVAVSRVRGALAEGD